MIQLSAYCSFLLPSTGFGDLHYLQTIDGHNTRISRYHGSSKMKTINHTFIIYPLFINSKTYREYALNSREFPWINKEELQSMKC